MMRSVKQRMSNVVGITPRLLPGVRVGDAWLSVEPTTRADADGKPRWRVYIDADEWRYVDEDLRGWGNAAAMLGAALGFLSACAESYRYTLTHDREGENLHLFPPHVAEWADRNADEIDVVRMEIEEK